jgi:hypothetical protein
MGKYHKPQDELTKVIEVAKTKVSIGSKYYHHKNNSNTYQIIDLGFLESNDELCVIYKALYGSQNTFIRPLSVWLEEVEWKGKTVPRFTKL